jgi:hypothetical protein
MRCLYKAFVRLKATKVDSAQEVSAGLHFSSLSSDSRKGELWLTDSRIINQLRNCQCDVLMNRAAYRKIV